MPSSSAPPAALASRSPANTLRADGRSPPPCATRRPKSTRCARASANRSRSSPPSTSPTQPGRRPRSYLESQWFNLLFINAGILLGRGQALADVPDTDVTDIFLTNAISPVRVADKLVGNVHPGGMIVFMSSILASISANDDGRSELYRASKAALNTLVRSFCARHPDLDATVLLMHPGVVRTAMGGPDAPLDIETSVGGVADVIEQRWGSGGHAFVDYRNQTIPW